MNTNLIQYFQKYCVIVLAYFMKNCRLTVHTWGLLKKSSSVIVTSSFLQRMLWLANVSSQNLNGGKNRFCFVNCVLGILTVHKFPTVLGMKKNNQKRV